MKIEVFNMDTDENPHLTAKAKEKYFARLRPDERAARKSGKWMHLAGLIYKRWHRDVHVVDYSKIKHDWPRGCVIDPAGRKPWALAWFAVDPRDRMWFYDEWPNFPFYAETSWVNKVEDYAAIIAAKEKIHNAMDTRWRILDPNFGRAGNATTGKALWEELEDYGYYFDTEVNDNIELGQQKVAEYLDYDPEQPLSSMNSPNMYVTDNCHNMIFGFEHYQWGKWRGISVDKGYKDKPEDTYKDFPDLARYAAMSDCVYAGGQMEVDNPMDDRGFSGYGF